MNKILIVDDNIDTRENIAELFSEQGYSIYTASDGNEALNIINNKYLNCVILDLKLPVIDGWEVLSKLKKKIEDGLVVIVITAFGAIESAVKAIKMGAFYFIEKPFNNQVLLLNVERGISSQSVKNELKDLKLFLGDPSDGESIFGSSDAAKKLINQINTVAQTDFSVLLQGETGSGKEVVATFIHNQSNRASSQMVTVNCGAIPEALFESELFGHEKGSFTGAYEKKEGSFQKSNKSTLFLDEIGNMPMSQQRRMLRVVESKRISPIGSKQDIAIDSRLIFATLKNLSDEVTNGNFREDLFYRISEYTIHIPPLRDRLDDIPGLVNKFIQETSKELGKNIEGISDEALELLIEFDWPGNIRQLRNVIRNSMLHATKKILPQHLSIFDIRNKKNNPCFDIDRAIKQSETYKEALMYLKQNIEKELLLRSIKASRNNISSAADIFGIDRTSFYKKMKMYAIDKNGNPAE